MPASWKACQEHDEITVCWHLHSQWVTPQAWDANRQDLGAIQKPWGWKWTWRVGNTIVCFPASSCEFHQTKEMAWILCHRLGMASASSSVPRALWRDKLHCATLESLHLFRDRILNMIIRVWSVKEETTGSDQWEDGWLGGRVGKGQPQKFAENSSSDFHKQGLGMWPRIIHIVSATYPILYRPSLITEVRDFSDKTVFMKEAEILSTSKELGGRGNNGQRSL